MTTMEKAKLALEITQAREAFGHRETRAEAERVLIETMKKEPVD